MTVLRDLEVVLHVAESDRTLKRLVITGSDEAFLAGADLNEISKLTAETAEMFALTGQAIMSRIERLPFRTVALINGPCYGGGLDLALACDERIATNDATFCHPGVGLGIITGWGGSQRLPRLVGETNALRLFFTAEPIDAVEALRIGLVGIIRV